MNFTFYNQLISQPDIEEIAPKIQPSLNVLDLLYSKLHDLPPKDLNTASFAEVSSKVDNLVNKHFPNLVHDYCKLSLEYRNTVVIKKEQSKGQVKEYTAKDILLNNLSKLIEEIHVLDNEFNENYTHKLLVQKRLVDQLGIQTDIIKTHANVVQPEVEYEKPNPVESFNYHKNDSNVNNTSNSQIKSKDVVSSGFSISLIEILLITGFITMFTILLFIIYSKVKDKDNTNKEMASIIELNYMVKNLYSMENTSYNSLNMDVLKSAKIIFQDKIIDNKYINNFEGETVVRPYTQKQNNDSFLIETSNVPRQACMKMTMELSASSPVLLVNDQVVKENVESALDIGSLAVACDHDSNKIGMVNQ